LVQAPGELRAQTHHSAPEQRHETTPQERLATIKRHRPTYLYLLRICPIEKKNLARIERKIVSDVPMWKIGKILRGTPAGKCPAACL